MYTTPRIVPRSGMDGRRVDGCVTAGVIDVVGRIAKECIGGKR